MAAQNASNQIPDVPVLAFLRRHPHSRAAARARATNQLRTLDAIQMAAALTAGATGLVTNHKDSAPLPSSRC